MAANLESELVELIALWKARADLSRKRSREAYERGAGIDVEAAADARQDTLMICHDEIEGLLR